MAVSGIDTWNPAIVFIIRQALLNVNAIEDDEQPSAAMYQDALMAMNGLVKSLEATGLHVWAEEEGILFLEPNVPRYTIGGPGPVAHTSAADDWLRLTVLQPAALGATTITVADAFTLADGDHFGIIDNDGFTEWTLVVGNPVAGVVTFADPLLVGVDAGNFCISYTTEISRPLKIPATRLLTLQNLNETPMTVLSRQEYMDLPQKVISRGTPTQFFYSPQRDTGLMYVWPVATTTAWAARFTWYRPLQDFLIPTNTADFPQEWILPLTWNLSKEIATSFGVPEPTWQRIVTMADTWALIAISYDRESEPIRFGMDDWQYG